MDEHTPHAAAQQPDLPEWLREMAGGEPGTPTGQVQQKISTFGVVSILVILGLLGVIAYALYKRGETQPTSGPAPSFAVTMYDFDPMAMTGQQVQLKDLRGKAVVVNFWASYCDPCKSEAPMLERVWNDYKDKGVVLLGINTNDPLKNALDYLTQYGITYPNAPDEGSHIENAYRITGIPETFVIDTQGKIVRHFMSEPNERDLRSVIDQALES
jgi:cytochrome c biogenesis protein CcmG/thiol:disulfide interchange protein DsbE